MKLLIAKIWCFLHGHGWLTIYSLNNAAMFDGSPRSSWGEHECTRCGKTKTWQWDHY